MAKIKPLERIFSIKNEGTNKVIRFLGIKLKIDRTEQIREFCRNIPIQKNKIIFNNFNGLPYGCNPKYIAEEIIRRKLPCEIYWLCKDMKNVDMNCFPSQIHVIPFKGKDALTNMSSAQIIIGNVRTNYIIMQGWEKKKGQTYIQTWHGSLGIKKIDASVSSDDFKKRKWYEIAKDIDSPSIDYLLSNSTFEDRVFEEGMWYSGPILKTGHPRNDIFFKPEPQKQTIREKVCSGLKIPTNKKIVLYVPSYRDDKRLDCYGLDVELLNKTLSNKFGSEWVCAIRIHPQVNKHSKELFEYNDNVIDASFYPDIQELLMSADCVITDYSSCIFDYMLSKKPAFIFATDIKEFNTERGFYYPLESTPFPISSDNNKLMENIKNFDMNNYLQKTEEFLKDKGCMEDGNAASRVVDIIEEILSKNKEPEAVNA